MGGWSVSDLQLGAVSDMAHSADGRAFIVVYNLGEMAAIVRDGVPTVTPVAGYDLVKTAGFSPNGKAWVLGMGSRANGPCPRTGLPLRGALKRVYLYGPAIGALQTAPRTGKTRLPTDVWIVRSGGAFPDAVRA